MDQQSVSLSPQFLYSKSMPQFLAVFLTLISNLLISHGIPSFIQTAEKATPPDLVAQRLSQMTLEEKIRQTLVCSFEGNALDSSTKVLGSCGNLIYSKSNILGLSEEEIYKINQAIHRNDPLTWIMVDQEGGRVARIQDGSPSPRKMATENTITYWGEQHGLMLKNLDFNIDLAPVVDITENNPVIEDRSFADDPTINGQMATEYLKALQGQGVLGVIKHLPGHGRVDSDTHKKTGSLDYSWDEIKNFDLTPFIDTINNSGARIVMIGHIVIPEIDKKPASISPIILEKFRQILPHSNDLIFLTDSLSMSGVGMPQEKAAIEALKAGEDMILIQGIDPKSLFQTIISAYKDGTLSEEKLNQSLTRILKIKLSQK